MTSAQLQTECFFFCFAFTQPPSFNADSEGNIDLGALQMGFLSRSIGESHSRTYIKNLLYTFVDG